MKRAIILAIGNLALLPWLGLLLFSVLPPGSVWVFRVSLAAGVIAWTVALHRLSRSMPASRMPDRLVWLSVAFGLLVALFLFVKLTGWEPYGMWDAWAVWNTKARAYSLGFLEGQPFLLFRPEWVHIGYPPFLPLLLGTLAVFFGGWHPLLPAALALFYYLVCVAMVFEAGGALPQTRRVDHLLGLAVLTLALPLIRQASFQVADFPLSVHLMFVCYVTLAVRPPTGEFRAQQAVLLGLALATIPNIKKEGALIVLVFLPVIALTLSRTVPQLTRERRATALGLVAGALLPACVWIWYRLSVPPDNLYPFDLQAFLGRLAQGERYALVGWGFVHVHLLLMLGVPFFALVRTLKHGDRSARLLMLACFAVLLVYQGVFLVTPLDLQWQLATAYERVTLQLYPALILILVSR